MYYEHFVTFVHSDLLQPLKKAQEAGSGIGYQLYWREKTGREDGKFISVSVRCHQYLAFGHSKTINPRQYVPLLL